jgi:hypothetical protein
MDNEVALPAERQAGVTTEEQKRLKVLSQVQV